MNRFLFFILSISLSTFNVSSQEISEIDTSPLDFALFQPENEPVTPVARIIYSRPHKKGRLVFGELVPYGEIWRTGANQTTELNLFQDVFFEGNKLKTGNYTIYTIPNENEWTIIVNSKLHTWGTYGYDATKDVLRFNVPSITISESRESFGIAFDGKNGKGKLLLAWENTEVYINLEY